MTTNTTSKDLPNGPVAAALLAGGIGSAALGILTILSEASGAIGTALNWYAPVGPLSGKTILTVIIFILSWAGLHTMYRGKEVEFQRIAMISFILLAIGLLGTFPPFFELFIGG